MVVDNRAGAGGNIGMGLAAHANPDGYTWLMVSSSFVVNPSLYSKIPYDPYRDLIPISNLAASPHAFFAHPSSPVKSIAELIALAKSSPESYSIATPGIGTTPDLSARLFTLTTGTDIVPVPYGGGGLSLAAVLGNQVHARLPGDSASNAAHQRRPAARARPDGAKRANVLPDVPTMAELGSRARRPIRMQGLLVPAGTPKAWSTKSAAEVRRILAQPDIKAARRPISASTSSQARPSSSRHRSRRGLEVGEDRQGRGDQSRIRQGRQGNVKVRLNLDFKSTCG